MKKQHDERGIAPIVIILGVLVFIAVAGLIVWRVMSTQSSTSQNTNQPQATNFTCDYDDKDLCKFFGNWQTPKSFRINMTQITGQGSTTSLFEMTADGKRFHMLMNITNNPYETITIDDTIYTKDNVDGKWWKQVSKPETIAENKAQYDPTFDTTQGDQEPAKRIEYKKIGMEACGQLQCFKYQIIDPADPKATQFLWFDDKDYQLRRMRTEQEGSAMDQTYSYENVTINVPAPVKELGPNQFVMPGSNEPQSMPQ